MIQKTMTGENHMAAYLISDLTVRERAAFETYRTRAADAIHTYGGRYSKDGGIPT